MTVDDCAYYECFISSCPYYECFLSSCPYYNSISSLSFSTWPDKPVVFDAGDLGELVKESINRNSEFL